MPRIIDGDNLLGSWPGRDRSSGEKRALAREVGRFALAERRRVLLVFDGEGPGSPLAGSEVLFAGGGRSADDLILATLRKESDRGGWTVVTNDRSLADRSRSLGARVERCDQFRGRLRSGTADEKPAADEIDYWIEQFGGDAGPPDRPKRPT